MRNVIVTGASRGIGLAIASTLAACGHRVIAVARKDSEELRSVTARAQEQQRGSVCFRAFDLMDTPGIAGFVSSLRKELGPLYGLVNGAGIGTAGILSIMRDGDIEALARLNMIAPITLTKYVLRSMMVERTGRIINIASIVAATGYSGLSVYAATKASLVGFTRSLAREVGRLGITVNAIAPGFAQTEMTRELDEDQRAQIMRRSALRRLIEPDDVAGAVEYLLSEKARNITGMTLTVDAGNTA